MKICPQCKTSFELSDFICPQCSFTPDKIDGFLAFAPENAKDTSGFQPEAFAHLYEVEAGSFWFKARNRLILWALDRFFPNAASILEIGCGTGFVLEGIAKHRPEIEPFGSELFVEGLAFSAKRLGGRARLFQMDARCIPFENEFDLIGAFDVLEHIKEDEAVLAQIHQAVAPGGGVLITVPQHMWMWSVLDELSKHQRRYSIKQLRHKLEQAGFVLVYATSFFSLLLPFMFIARHRRVITAEQINQQLAQGPLNPLLEAVMNLELYMIQAGVRLPFGGSLLVVGKRQF